MGGLVTTTLDRLTVARSGAATRVNASGLIETVSANTARIDYDPATLAIRGLLGEEDRTNLLSYSRQFDGAGWAVESLVTTSANVTTSPDGTTNAYKLIAASGTGNHSLFRASSVSFTSGDTFAVSIFAKSAELSKFRLTCTSGGNGFQSTFDLSAATATGAAVGTGTMTLADIKQHPSGWYRCIVIGRLPSASTSVNPRVQLLDAGGNLSFAGDGTSGIYIYGAQFEIGTFATSYIPTTTTTASRGAEAIWAPINSQSGTVFLKHKLIAVRISSQGPASAGKVKNSTSGAEMMLRIGAIIGGTDLYCSGVVDTNSYTTAANTLYSDAYAFATDDMAYSRGGASPFTDTSGTIPAGLDRLYLFDDSYSGWISEWRYWPRRLTNAELQAMTA